MGFIRTLVIGAAVGYGIQYITKKREDGSSILGDIMNDPSDFVNKAQNYATETVERVTETAKRNINI
ncbi:MAG: YtxH domain-containing protein [Mucilaginibacter sp.]|uniref:YtxH domain-containing protein n=1 Tax=Mucilaginibacter sp. TaxID=1882438 RepID=UPI00326623E7